ncbi:MAG: DUF3575 domain-containing protein [Bacteroidales bacterium]|nr:DUF3575 domain-containing protein [Bacteroidales bacterium]
MKNANRRIFEGIMRTSKAASLRLTVLAACLFANIFFTRAQDTPASVKINFPFDNAVLHTDYMSNYDALATLDKIAEESLSSNTPLDVVSYSSPEGNYTYNLRLSQRRAKSVSDYLVSKFPGIVVNIVSEAESWALLRTNIQNDESLNDNSRSVLLEIVDSEKDPDSKESQLKANSRYKHLYSSYFRGLRYAVISLRTEKSAENAQSISNSEISETSAEESVISADGSEISTEDSTDSESKAAQSSANETENTVSGLPAVYYSKSEDFIRPGFMGNEASLREIRRILSDPANRDKQIVIYGAASPEGPVSTNERLGSERAENLKNWLTIQFPDLEGRIVTRSKGEDWDGLRNVVESCESLDSLAKSEILDILSSSDSPAKKEAALKAHPSYKVVEDECLPRIRYSSFGGFEPMSEKSVKPAIDNSKTGAAADSVKLAADTTKTVVDTTKTVADTAKVAVDTTVAASADSTAVTPAETLDTLAYTPEFKPKKKMIAAVKTNLLFDAVTALNFEVEVPIGKRFSVMAEDVFPWWETGNKYCFQMWEMGLEGRYWFKGWDPQGTEKLRGFFAGVYAMSSKYDFQFDRDINLQGEYWSAGVSAGYAMPIGRRKRVNLEFSLAVGPLHTVFRHYQPTQTYDKLIRDPYNAGIDYKTGQWYFGPTKAKISLVVPINVPTGKKEVRYE